MPEMKIDPKVALSMRARTSAAPKATEMWNNVRTSLQRDGECKADNEILIYSVIVNESEASWLRCWGDEFVMTGAEFKQQLAQIEGDVVVRINSDGGDVFEGSTIVQAIQERIKSGGSVKCIVDGMCASIASVISSVCSDVTIASMGSMMIHKALTFVYGNDDDFEKAAKMLKGKNEQAAKIYSKKTGKTETKVMAAMKEETFYTAEEAVDFGLADQVFEPEDDEVTFKKSRDAKMQNFSLAMVAA